MNLTTLLLGWKDNFSGYKKEQKNLTTALSSYKKFSRCELSNALNAHKLLKYITNFKARYGTYSKALSERF